MRRAARVTVVGESLVDLLWRKGEDQPRAVAGGSPANVAVGLRRLGREVTLVTTRGDDPPGELVRARVEEAGLDVRWMPSSGSTTVALAHLDDAGAARYEFLASWAPDELTVPADTAVIHTGSLAAVLEPGARRVLELCARQREAGVSVAADLNVRPAAQPDRERYRVAARRLASATDVLKASDEDLGWLYPGQSPERSARRLLAEGPRLVVVTLGAAGALGVAPSGTVRVTAPPVEVVDTVGAGDAFQAALLDAVARDGVPSGTAELTRVLERCARAGALTCTRAGSQPPTLEELDGPGAGGAGADAG
ncbi:carbohydrate kinase [Streptomyces calidiresistens]|uniref:carbohydrate kinase family protein n=1 Tax=Streptomyces calidiresistens TaxID=1485586 RepID=UPI002B1EEB3E|nr:carbohydrate kinase [Streptomyces calidiresistens]